MDFIDFYNLSYRLMYYEVIKGYLAALLIALSLYLVNFTLEAVGLYTMAKKANNKHKWMAFVPFCNTYLIGELGGDGYLFSAKIKRSGLWAMVTELIAFLCGAFYFILGYLIDVNCTYNPTTNTYTDVPKSLAWAVLSIDYIGIVMDVLNLAYIIFLFVVLFAFFKKYFYRNPMIMTISAFFFPFTKGAILFAIRNNKPVDYEEYLRRQQELYRKQYQSRNPYDQNPYNRTPYGDSYGNPYRNPPDRRSPSEGEPPDPFEEFSSPNPKEEGKREGEKPKSGNDDLFN
ncbi:MAG: hypothetical protein J6D37_08535 [Clostridia bacterium]|nr:hypothetical protein [Clostridia bacterium]